ncbi:MAG: pyruvate dehydrogenase complex E1 component subunit beta, partial [Steroidobacteraceae bacterium]|nr:pyruvate dehydrogenase complex E1 component subunit beta [Steroidobacteraceae bacterium]MDW8260192.1 pyruvate dehydrogenase complex E1 component subunit beta [Gammaproteobacteria bacterium]
MNEMSYREAIRESLREALAADPRVMLIGEDVGRYGGTYAVSQGLLEEFGPQRVRDAPLSELGFTGAGVGAALGGLRPIIEIMSVNFSLLALDQIVNSAATLRYMSGGQLSVPLVIRMATGAGRQLAAQHSHSFDGWFAHVPGIKVLSPATITDARYAVPIALADPDPVIVLEHVRLYSTRGPLLTAPTVQETWRACVRRAGRDVTLIAWGGMVTVALTAAERLAAQEIEAEVIDLRCLRPLDVERIVESVRRTHRAVVIDEAWRTASFAAEICACLAEQALYQLDAPVARVC